MTDFNIINNKLKTYFNISDDDIINIRMNYTEPNFPKEIIQSELDKYYSDISNSKEAIVYREREEVLLEQKHKTAILLKYIKQLNIDCTILDFGCGIGQYTFDLTTNGYHTEAVDYGGVMLDWIKFKCDNKNLITTPLENYKWDRKYNVIICSHVIEHVPNPEELLDSLIQHTEYGGLLLLDYPVIWNEPDKNPEHLGKDEFRTQIIDILRANDFILLHPSIGLWKKINTAHFQQKIEIIVEPDNLKLNTTYTPSQAYEMIGILESIKQICLGQKLKNK